MPHLECINEQFKHYFIVDTPPSSPKRISKFDRSISLWTKIIKIINKNLSK